MRATVVSASPDIEIGCARTDHERLCAQAPSASTRLACLCWPARPPAESEREFAAAECLRREGAVSTRAPADLAVREGAWSRRDFARRPKERSAVTRSCAAGQRFSLGPIESGYQCWRCLPAVKLRVVRALQRYVFNPPIKLLFRLGFVPPGYALLETVGRRSGLPRQTPVGDGLIGDTFWIVAEHGLSAAYVRNLQAEPRVRVQMRRGRRTVWRTGIAHVLADDDPRERQRQLALTSLNRRLNAFVVRAAGTELATVRIDLDA
jgi:deazaflavin-dependent oxidoreductase (nitroreductase family)